MVPIQVNSPSRVISDPPERPARLRGPLKWGLVGTLLVTVAAVLWPTPKVVGVQGQTQGPTAVPAPSRHSDAVRPADDAGVDMSVRPQPLIEATASVSALPFDPFVGVVVPPPPPLVVVQPAPVVAAPSPPPTQEYRFLGRMTGPDGVEQILLTRGESAVAIKVGTVLDNGYIVESIVNDSAVLAFPSLGTRVSLSIPVHESAQ
jgi:hypothetical protein